MKISKLSAKTLTFFVFSLGRYYVTFVPLDGVLSLASLPIISGSFSWQPATVAARLLARLGFHAAKEIEMK